MHTTLIRTVAVAVAVALALAVVATSAGARTVIQNKGSDTLVNVAQAWAENYQNVNADVAVAVSGGGSGTAIAAMINATVDIANASRQMKRKEIDLAKSRGQDPVEHVVGYDALAVFLHLDNPLDTVSIAQLAEMYGEEGETESWSQLGIEVPGCKGQEIILVSRQNNSGTYAYFRKAVLGAKRDYKLGTHDMHGSKDVVHLVENTPCAIGYSGLAYATDHVKMPCIAVRGRRGLRQPERRHRERRELPHCASAVHVHQRRAAGGDQELSRLDPERRRPVHHSRQGLRTGTRGPVQLSATLNAPSGRSRGAPS